ncbi:hypothetical protein ACUN7V_02410 [Quadrisphaera oryzae]|nr:hypothetical protein [Quadrisphaera sp. RL12-1S]MBC3761079.1 hypothetical protein [Quadrisphaera sp. RL12-1S]
MTTPEPWTPPAFLSTPPIEQPMQPVAITDGLSPMQRAMAEAHNARLTSA